MQALLTYQKRIIHWKYDWKNMYTVLCISQLPQQLPVESEVSEATRAWQYGGTGQWDWHREPRTGGYEGVDPLSTARQNRLITARDQSKLQCVSNYKSHFEGHVLSLSIRNYFNWGSAVCSGSFTKIHILEKCKDSCHNTIQWSCHQCEKFRVAL